MSHQTDGNDGEANYIDLKRADNQLHIYINNQLAYKDDVENIESLTVQGSTDDDILRAYLETDDSDSDLVSLGGEINFHGGLAGAVKSGGIPVLLPGNDRIEVMGTDLEETFNVTSAGVTTLSEETLGLFEVDGVEKMVLEGRGGPNRFTINGIQSNLQEIELTGSGDTDTVYGPDQSNNWQITGWNEGTLNDKVSFSQVEDLVGGSMEDVFSFEVEESSTIYGALTAPYIFGKIDGRAGTDSLAYADYLLGSIGVNLRQHHATGVNVFTDIERLVGSPAAGDTIHGPNYGAAWDMTNATEGTVSWMGGAFPFLVKREFEFESAEKHIDGLAMLRRDFGFWFDQSYYEDALGFDEKWFKDRHGDWYTITSDGTIRLWEDGDQDLSDDPVVATVAGVVYDDPTLLFNAK